MTCYTRTQSNSAVQYLHVIAALHSAPDLDMGPRAFWDPHVYTKKHNAFLMAIKTHFGAFSGRLNMTTALFNFEESLKKIYLLIPTYIGAGAISKVGGPKIFLGAPHPHFWVVPPM